MSFDSTVTSASLPTRQRALDLFLERGERVAERQRMQRLHPGQALAGRELASVREPPRDGRVEVGQGIDVLDRHIGARRQRGAARQQLPPDVGPLLHARRSNAIGHPGAVRGGMDWLHRGNDAERREARDVGGTQQLRVLDAPAQIGSTPAGALERRLVDVQHLAIGAIADGVHGELIALLDREPRHLRQRLHRRPRQPHALRLVGVRLEQPGPARAHGAIGILLDPAHGQHVVRRRRRSGSDRGWP